MPDGDYNTEEVENKWSQKWVENKTFAYTGDSNTDKENVFSIDTPPPTVSGSLHFGHTYGNTLADFQARFQRMRGKDVYFPFGYDNNGIASERLTERELDIRHQDFTRREFQEKCREVCQQYEEEFTEGMQEFAFSMDWENTYKTIEPRVQKTSQLSFIELYEKDREYREKAPAIWCPECETAISQVETEDDERGSSFNDIEFPLASKEGSVTISTTRPELLPACVSIFVHPDDEEHQDLIGEKAEVPLFGHEVPIIEDNSVDLETGTGVVMCCTFGDQNDIEWYKTHDLPLRVAIDESGTMTELSGDYEGMSTERAREAIIEDLDEEDYLLETEDISHTVQVHERCGTGIEFLVTEQWYIKVLDKKEEYLEAGREMDWHPEKMFIRYKNWIDGLQWDWCISRQRDSGIPFPVWYCDDCGETVVAEKEDLPVDPIEDEPRIDECPECEGSEFKPEEDVFDTWATSSLTPLINAEWHGDGQMNRSELYPFNLRYQGHDIISFWLFHTVVKCYEHTGETPFDEVQINGMILDENRKKMSKSVGNVTTPNEIVDEFSVDAARYWTAGSSVGDDLALKKKEIESGEKLIRKLWNASKLIEHLGTKNMPNIDDERELEEIDRWMLAEIDELIDFVTEKFESYEYSKARDRLRHVFWDVFCDDYLEITKQRLDGEKTNISALYTLQKAHRSFLKMFAPYTCFVTEEIWQDMYAENEEDSIHSSEWPEQIGVEANLEKGETAMEVISALRKYKTQNQMSPTAELEEVEVYGNIAGFGDAIKGAMHVENLIHKSGEPETKNQIVEIKLDYSKAGPKFGNDIGEIEEALENQEWNIDAGMLEAADHHIPAEMYEVMEERIFQGEGEMFETENATVVVK